MGKSHTTPPQPPTQLITITDGGLSVTVDAARGGAIVDITITDGQVSSGNIVNDSDKTGRQVQLSMYEHANTFDPSSWPCSNSKAKWGWNPVLCGNACQNLTGNLSIDKFDKSIEIRSNPLQWNNLLLKNSNIEVITRTEIISTGVIKLQYHIWNKESFAVGTDGPHEAPCVYLTPDFIYGIYHQGGAILRTTDSINNFKNEDSYIMLQHPQGWTIALVAPNCNFSFNFGKQIGKECSLMQAWQMCRIEPGDIATITAYLVVGHSYDEVIGRIPKI